MLDTSTVIMLPRLRDAALLPAEPLITAVTLAELSVGPLVASTDEERAARQAHLQQAEADFDPLPFDAPQPGGHAAERVHATSASAKTATFVGSGPYMPSRTPKGRSSGNLNSRFPTSMREPAADRTPRRRRPVPARIHPR